MFSQLLTPLPLAQWLCMLWLAVLFLQSGGDKIFDWQGNLTWLKGHFSNTFLKNVVTPLLLVITIVEVFAGLVSLGGAVVFCISGELRGGIVGAGLSGLALLMLFTGQRIAKDYEGAAALVPYFLLTIISLYLFQV